MPKDPRSDLHPMELIFELLYDAESFVVSATEAAQRHSDDSTVVAELAALCDLIATVRARYNTPPPAAAGQHEGATYVARQCP